MKTTIKITIEDDNGNKSETEYDFPKCNIEMEKGIRVSYPDNSGLPFVEHNGQVRLVIKAWSGCEEFDDFIAHQ